MTSVLSSVPHCCAHSHFPAHDWGGAECVGVVCVCYVNICMCKEGARGMGMDMGGLQANVVDLKIGTC